MVCFLTYNRDILIISQSFMAFLGIFLRDGLLHQSYKKWEVSFKADEISNSAPNVYNYVAGNQYNITGDHCERLCVTPQAVLDTIIADNSNHHARAAWGQFS